MKMLPSQRYIKRNNLKTNFFLSLMKIFPLPSSVNFNLLGVFKMIC